MPIVNGEYVFEGLDLTEGATNSFGQPVVGGESTSARLQREETEAANEQTWTDTLGITNDQNDTTLIQGIQDQFTSGGNYAYDILSSLGRKTQHEFDPEFNASKWIDDNRKIMNIEDSYMPAYMGASSASEAADIAANIKDRQAAQKRIQRMGITGQLSSGMIAGMFDVDTLLSGGTAAIVGKTGVMATRMGQIMSGTAAGTIGATAGAAASPEDDWENVAVAAIFSAGFATLGSRKALPEAEHFNRTVSDMGDSLDNAIKNRNEGLGRPPERDPDSVANPAWNEPHEVPEVLPEKPMAGKSDAPAVEGEVKTTPAPKAFTDSMDDLDFAEDVFLDPDLGKSSIGARQLNSTSMGLQASTDTARTIADAQSYVRQNRLYDYFYDYQQGASNIARGVGSAMRTAADVIGSIPAFAQDYDRLMRSGSAVLQKIAHTTGSDGAARNVNLNSAAHIQKDYLTQLQGLWHPTFTDARKSYVKRNGGGLFSPVKNLDIEKKFNQDIFLAAEHATRNGALDPNLDPDVKRALEGINAAWKKEAEVGKGDGQTNFVNGYQFIKSRDWYMPHRVSSGAVIGKLRELNTRAKRLGGRSYKEKDVEDMYTEAYSQFALRPDDARVVAKSILARAKSRDRGANTSLYGLLQEGNTDFLEQMLRAQKGVSQPQVDRIMRTLVGDATTRGQSGHTRSRLDMDLNFQASNGLKVIDFIDTDISRVVTGRMSQTAGWAALARNGIKSQIDIDRIIDAAEHEMADKMTDAIRIRDARSVSDAKSAAVDWLDNDRPVNRQWLENYFAQFTGAGGSLDTQAAAITSRVKKAVGLSTLNGLGIPQLMESSNVMAFMGYKDFLKTLPDAVRVEFGNARSDLVQDLNSIGKMIPEEKLFDLGTHAEMEQLLHSKSEQTFWIDRMLGKGMELQGMMTGMFKIREMQKKMVLMVATDRLMRGIKSGAMEFSPERLATIGVDQKLMTDLQGVIQHIDWDGDNVKRLNFDKWQNEDLVQNFSRVLGIAADQAVQAARKGENNILLTNNGIVSLMTQFLSYPITAINKQAARNAYVGDTEAMMAFLYGVALSGALTTARAVAYNRHDDITLGSVARNGFMQSNLTGWIPMASDPVMSLLGMDDFKFDQYGTVLRSPPALEVLPRIAKSPFALGGLIAGDTSKANLRDVRALPLIGNWYASQAILNRIND
ncbi:internal capsid protein [Rhizobium phage Paso]|uniref:Internal capsid protein n=1 Tax=Rhizobium phage Paso TaxID=2767574 RepID=A0A7L8G515_9CAUD|nr:internal capsid protein [Rhizobium phage Paso]